MELRVDVQKNFGSFSFAADFTVQGDATGVSVPPAAASPLLSNSLPDSTSRTPALS